MVFDKKWFEDNQKILLFLANNFLLKYWFRWVLRIHKDLKYSEKISEIQPNNYKVKLPDGSVKADFRTHDKFSKRLYFAFKPYWYLLHNLDLYILNRLELNYNFGFDTLDAYSQTGGGGSNTTCDGRVFLFNTSTTPGTWAQSRATASGSANDSANGNYTYIRCDGVSTRWDYISRGYHSFNITSVGTGSVTSATLKLKTYSATDGWSGGYGVSIVESTQANANNITTSDYTSYGTTRFATDISYSSMSGDAYRDFTFNSDGITYLNANDIVKFCAITSCDLDNSEPTWVSGRQAYCNVYWADYTGTSSDPYLSVTYSPAGTATNKIVGIL